MKPWMIVALAFLLCSHRALFGDVTSNESNPAYNEQEIERLRNALIAELEHGAGPHRAAIPNVRQIVDSQDFLTWADKQSVAMQAMIDSSNPDEAAVGVRAYMEFAGIKSSTSQDRTEPDDDVTLVFFIWFVVVVFAISVPIWLISRMLAPKSGTLNRTGSLETISPATCATSPSVLPAKYSSFAKWWGLGLLLGFSAFFITMVIMNDIDATRGSIVVGIAVMIITVGSGAVLRAFRRDAVKSCLHD